MVFKFDITVCDSYTFGNNWKTTFWFLGKYHYKMEK
jgi:hypothetical protein